MKSVGECDIGSVDVRMVMIGWSQWSFSSTPVDVLPLAKRILHIVLYMLNYKSVTFVSVP